MTIFVLVSSLVFVILGLFLVWKGNDSVGVWAGIVFFGGGGLVALWHLATSRGLGRAARAPLEDDEPLRTIVVKSSCVHWLVYAVGSACFAVAGALMIWSGKELLAGCLTVGFFGLGAVILLWRALDRRPRLVIDEEGIFDRTLGVGYISWADIEGAYLRSVEGNDMLCLIVRDPSIYLNRLSPWRQKLVKASLALGFTELNVNLAGLEVDTNEVCRVLRRFVREHQR